MNPIEATADSWTNGIEPIERLSSVGSNSWLTALIVIMLVVVAFNVQSLRQITKTFRQDLFSAPRRRGNVFDEHTAGEKRASALTILLLCIFEGVLMLRFALNHGYVREEHLSVASLTLALSGLALVIYVGRVGLYMLAGTAFADREDLAQWRRGFNASQILLCFLIAVPALLALFYPQASNAMTIIAIGLFFICQGLFIAKTYRIFFNNFGSALYFILYLCALEITPVFLAIAGYDSLISDF